jgi:hemerythrin-like metal-binding protein
MLINWCNEYSVSVREIDLQHKKLIAIINELNKNMVSDADRDDLQHIFNELVNYAAYHFSFEEKLFAQYSYSEIQQHMQSHSIFIEQLKNLIKKFEGGDTTLNFELMDFLKRWLVDHIMGTDKKYSAFLNSKGIY